MSGQSDIRIQTYNLPRIDTHCHLPADLYNLREEIKGFGHFEFCQPQMDSRAAAAGCPRLYGVDPGPFLRPDSPESIFEQAEALRAKGITATIEHGLDMAKITQQVVFCDMYPEKCSLWDISGRLYGLVYADALIAGEPMQFCPDGHRDDFCYYDELCKFMPELASLDDYFGHIDTLAENWRKHERVVGVKLALAYTLGLHFVEPNLDDARQAFARKRDMTEEDVRTVTAAAFHRVLQACRDNGLPVVIHTGFQIWGHPILDQSRPMMLHNLLIDKRYKDLTFVLLHGGNPYVGEITYLAGMFPNVIIDFTWISWMTRTRFRFALAEWLEVVPHDRFCWGSDSNGPETIVGVDAITRNEIANVLEDTIERGIMNEPLAMEWLENTYTNTPKRVFGIK